MEAQNKILTAEEKEKRWDKRFMEMALLVSTWSSCVRCGRQVGAVIVKDHRILTTGYNGAPAGIKTCVEKGVCLRDNLGIQSGTRQEMCYAIHAEQNAVIQAAKTNVNIDGATIYVTHQPCSVCTRILINAGIKKIIYKEGYPDSFSLDLIKEAGIKIEKLEV